MDSEGHIDVESGLARSSEIVEKNKKSQVNVKNTTSESQHNVLHANHASQTLHKDSQSHHHDAHRHSKGSILAVAQERASGAGSFLCLPIFDDFQRENVASEEVSDNFKSWYPKRSESWLKLLDYSKHSIGNESTHSTSNLLGNSKKEEYAKAFVEHMMSLAEISRIFSTSIDTKALSKSTGLTEFQAKYLLKKFGKNLITPPVRTPLWQLFLLQFTNMFMVLLLVAALLSIVTWAIHPLPRDPMNLYLGIFLIVVVILTCYSTYRQEAKSDELMTQFKAMVPSACSVIRDGITRVLAAEDLVVGDLLWLKTGDKVPADCRIVYNTGLRVDQSMLTGESEPVDSTEDAADTSPLEARNLIFSGSLIVDGGALAVVIRTADSTLLGSMVRLTGDMGKSESTLKADVNAFVWVVTKIAVIMASFIFIIGIARGLPVFQTLLDGFIGTMTYDYDKKVCWRLKQILYY